MLQPVKRLGEIPRVGIAITARREVIDREPRQLAGFSTEVRGIDNDEFPCHCRIEQRKNEVRASKACIHGFYIVGKTEALELLNHCGTKPVIGKQRVATPCDHDLGIQHAGILTG